MNILSRPASLRRERNENAPVLLCVKFIVKKKMYIGNWCGKSYQELKEAFFEAYGLGRGARCPPMTSHEEKAFALVDQTHCIAYHNFRLLPKDLMSYAIQEKQQKDSEELEDKAVPKLRRKSTTDLRTSFTGRNKFIDSVTETHKNETSGINEMDVIMKMIDSDVVDVYPGCIFQVNVSMLNLKPSNNLILQKLGNNLLLAGRAAKILTLTGTSTGGMLKRMKKSRMARAGTNVKHVVSLSKDLARNQTGNNDSNEGTESGEEVESSDDVELAPNEMSLRQKIWAVMEDPEQKSVCSRIITVIITIMIMISVIVALVESLLMYADHTPQRFFVIESVCVICFTIEFVLRVSTCPEPISFMKNWMNIVDLVAIIPYYVDVTLQQKVLRRNYDDCPLSF